MTTETFHPDHLKPGDMVGTWRIVESLGSGTFGHAFKAERDGAFFTLKMAVRPAPELPQETSEKTLEERQVDGRMYHEAAILMANTSHPGLPHLREVGRWPHSTKDYFYFVTDFVPGGPFHAWRAQVRPTAAQLVDVFIEVVRAVARLHRRGVLIRDFKSEHVIINPEDNKPVLVDLGSAWLPGGSTLTVGLAPGTPHALPPECIAFIRQGAWREGARFNADATGDLYQVGVFMYEALTDGWPFNPRLTKDELLVAIETVVPRAPHHINPEVPESLSRITLKLLEKRPEDRYPSAEALLQALWEAAKERSTPAWKVPVELPPEGPAPATLEELEERRLQKREAERRAQEAQKEPPEELSREQAVEQLSFLTREIHGQLQLADEEAARRKRRWRRIGGGAGALLLGLVLFVAWQVWRTPVPASPAVSEKGNPFVSTVRNSRPVRATIAWLCTTFSVGCAAPQVRPMSEACPQEALRSMDERRLFSGAHSVAVVIDINQPGWASQQGVYRPGPIVSKVVKGVFDSNPLPEGTLLYGQLWTEGLTKEGEPAVMGRYTEVLLPDGVRFPVCFVLADPHTGLFKTFESKPGEVILPRESSAFPVRYWP
ncbi:serine/threonine protein kinase [Hyalangium minutum]|uniref:non-specific serine/threonine protein kinase n=1 Tax=Hyalangium minutum TaxID=394096 RepID=A0A085W9N6_9BACT|nr:protein kinase [Hyalangium minutum]KFE64399.1 serine/threonine-protein kinase [Hyalangium minutum]